MSTLKEYKGYVGTVDYSAEDRCFYGKIAGIRDSVLYDGKDVDTLERSFHNAVDEYLAFCKQKAKSRISRSVEPSSTPERRSSSAPRSLCRGTSRYDQFGSE